VSFLLDTNVVSEWVKPRPDLGVMKWVAEVDEDRAYLSVITFTELRYGIERMTTGQRRKRLADWLDDELPLRFEGRVISIDDRIADLCGRMIARSEAAGRRLEAMDAFIAATAEFHRLTLITRNTADFEPVLKDIFNPWTT
jgi:toxin FitB